MKPTPSKKHFTQAVDVDSLLQDSYLLVVELRQKTAIHSGEQLVALCVKQIEDVRQQLEKAGLSQRSIEHISHAQCALLDETVLACAEGDDHARWANEPMQARFFDRHQAGVFLYEDMREVLREPAPDVHVLTAFNRVLMLGFQGRYRNVDSPEREQLLAALSAQVAPLELSRTIPTQVGTGSRFALPFWLQSAPAQVCAAGLLLGATWWGLDYFLGAFVTTLVPGV